MIPGTPFQGSLFADDFLRESIVGVRDWEVIDDAALNRLETNLRNVFEHFPTNGTPNESQTEDDLNLARSRMSRLVGKPAAAEPFSAR